MYQHTYDTPTVGTMLRKWFAFLLAGILLLCAYAITAEAAPAPASGSSAEDMARYLETYNQVMSVAPEECKENQLALERLAAEYPESFGLPAATDISYEDALWLAYAAIEQKLGVQAEDMTAHFPYFCYIVGDASTPYWQVQFAPLTEGETLYYEVNLAAADGTLLGVEGFHGHG